MSTSFGLFTLLLLGLGAFVIVGGVATLIIVLVVRSNRKPEPHGYFQPPQQTRYDAPPDGPPAADNRN
ncbi:MAG TPA: hypothetical protein H9830_02685 [Candidatus Agrococcus pullicola]|uniref:Uncharacterized protein n=1 Tax=Candidatus Agrococcus pullicola TaxID=2838429 RepID=A0A9D1YTF6_9MICO|nr:hypothetical protein [Candidatus Agrococcus pullicola]